MKDSFKEDADEKVNTFLDKKEFSCYHDKDVRCYLTDKVSRYQTYRRRGEQLEKLSEITKKECSSGGSLYKSVRNTLGKKAEVKKVVKPLIKVVREKNMQFYQSVLFI